MTIFIRKYAEYIITVLVLIILILIILLVSGIGLSKIDREVNSLTKQNVSINQTNSITD